MKIIRTIQKNGTLEPRASAIIRAIPKDVLCHELHAVKHPLTVYGTSISRITTAWLKIFPLYESLFLEVACNLELSKRVELLEAYEVLLYRLNEHIDACHEVLRSLRPPIPGKIYETHARFLWETKLPGFRAFKDSIHNGYREQHIGIIVNEMKHSSAQLRSIVGRTEKSVVLGYFLDGPHPRGALGPNSRLHKNYRGMYTAFSFSRDMLMHFWWIYQISEAVSRCVEMTMQSDHGLNIREDAKDPLPHPWNDLCHKVSQLQPFFFLDECEKPYPIVICDPDKRAMSVEFQTLRRATPYKEMDIVFTSDFPEGAGGIAMPYFVRPKR